MQQLKQNNRLHPFFQQSLIWRYLFACMISLFSLGCDPNSSVPASQQKFLDADTGQPLLYEAVKHYDLPLIDKLLKMGADINIRDEFGLTPLFAAIVEGDTEIISFLLKRGANVNIQDYWGSTPLHSAVDTRRINVVKLLLKQKNIDINIQDKEGETPIYTAVREGDRHIVDALLEKGAQLELKNNQGKQPLDLAREKKQFEIIEAFEENIMNQILTPQPFDPSDITEKEIHDFIQTLQNNMENINLEEFEEIS